jgi:hypothetical protein
MKFVPADWRWQMGHRMVAGAEAAGPGLLTPKPKGIDSFGTFPDRCQNDPLSSAGTFSTFSSLNADSTN